MRTIWVSGVEYVEETCSKHSRPFYPEAGVGCPDCETELAEELDLEAHLRPDLQMLSPETFRYLYT